MPIDLHYLSASAPCRHVTLVAAALDVDLNLIPVNMTAGDHLKPEYLKINPQHTIPTMVDDGFSLWESRAITRYLVNKYGGKNNSLYPEDVKLRALIDQRLDFDLGTLSARYAQYFYPQLFEGVTNEAHFKKLLEALEFLNTFLEGQKYAVGDELTLADLSLVATVSTIEGIDIDLKPYPNILRWYELVKSTAPKYEEANAKGVEEYKVLVAELKAKMEAEKK